MKSLPALTGIAFLTASCAAVTTTPLPSQPVNSSFNADGFTWNSGGGINVSMKAFEKDGLVGVCGLRSELSNQGDPSVDLNPWALQNMRIVLADDTVFSDVGAFPKTSWNENAAPTGTASCFLTDVPWRAAYAGARPDVKMARTSYKYYD